jgi:hypothetical protein
MRRFIECDIKVLSSDGDRPEHRRWWSKWTPSGVFAQDDCRAALAIGRRTFASRDVARAFGSTMKNRAGIRPAAGSALKN